MRYLPLTRADRAAMLEAIGASSVDELYSDVPEGALLDAPVDLPSHLGEMQVERDMMALAAKNVGASSVPSFLGAGAYRHHVPATVDYIIQRGEFLTAYTPYQPEIAQGTLDRKSTRLNSSHITISYAVFCLKKKKTKRKNI